MINVDEQLIKNLTKEIDETIEEYLKARKRNPEYKPIQHHNLIDGLDETIERLHKHGGIFTEHNLTLNAEDYWEDVVRAKIKIIGMVGGVDLMRKVYNGLGSKEQGVFNSNADGIAGWWA